MIYSLDAMCAFLVSISIAVGVPINNGTFKMKPDQVLIIEGIHGLNPDLTPHIDPARKFGIFVSALTQISIDAQNPISSTDNRLFRRMVRDYRFRGYSALETLRRWDSVRNGEEKISSLFKKMPM